MTNFPFAIVGGQGGINVSGNLANAAGGIWDPKVSWCAAGTDSGMPTPENCAHPCSNLLPVTLISFEAKALGGGRLQLDWVTATESNNDFFTIERSIDDNTYEMVGIMTSPLGNVNSAQDYYLVDEYALEGVAYYRLKQTDFDGTETILGMINVLNDDIFDSHAALYPNPLGRDLTISFNGKDGEELSVSIFDLAGKKMLSRNQTQSGGYNQIVLDLDELPAGQYFAELWFGRTTRQFTKIVKQ